MAEKIWEASDGRKAKSAMTRYMKELMQSEGMAFSDYKNLHQWSYSHPENFWMSILRFFKPITSGETHPVLKGKEFQDVQWFSNLRLNFAENMLTHSFDSSSKARVALNFQHESGLFRKITYGELKDQVHKLQVYLKYYIQSGDVVAAYTPNIPEAVITSLAASSLGAIFTSSSSELGVDAIMARLSQTQPKILVAATRYTFKGREYDVTERIQDLQRRLPSLKQVILVDFLSTDTPCLWQDCTAWNDIVSGPKALGSLRFTPMPFDAPLYVLYTSGTTGKPKCIVHGVGGTLINHLKELGLHSDIQKESRIAFYTSTSWMMWNWLISSLFFGAEVVLYDGSPSFPRPAAFLEMAKREKVSVLGLSPNYLRVLQKVQHALPKDFPQLKTILSTGSPLLPEQFDFVYEKIKKDLQLSSMSGGTDILGCFVLGNPNLPVNRGEIQCIGLGLDVVAYSDTGQTIYDQEGELVCRTPFPNAPLFFWNDPDNSVYRKAYFRRFPGTWHHGDFIRLGSMGGAFITGRSDATLNPGGVRVGTAEIYRQTDKVCYIDDSICVGRRKDDEEDVFLFVKMKEGESLSEERREEIREHIRQNASPRHVPHQILAVKDIPYTHSGKKMELVISELLRGRMPGNLAAVSNPRCLSEYPKLVAASQRLA